MSHTPLLERAFELARSGEFMTISGVGRALKREKYSGVEPMLSGTAIRKQLRDILRARRSASPGAAQAPNAHLGGGA